MWTADLGNSAADDDFEAKVKENLEIEKEAGAAQ